jgi:transposase-like protein
MRYKYKCPKCESNDVIEVIGSNINQYQKIPLTKWGTRNVVLDRYICASCGYTEEWVQLSEKFKKWAFSKLDSQDGKYDEYV